MNRLLKLLRNNPNALRELEFILLAGVVAFAVVYFSGFGETVVRPAFNASPLRGGPIALFAVVMIGAVIFAARRWREAQRAEAQYRAIFDNSIEGFFQTTREGKYLSVNPAQARLYGYASPEEMVASVKDIGKEQYADARRRDDFVRLMEEHGEVRDFENRIRCKDGRVIWVLANARAVRNTAGKILYYEGNVQDITARKEAEEAYQRLVEQSQQGITIIQDRKIVFANPAQAELTGYSIAELEQMSADQVDDMIMAEDRPIMQQRAVDRLAGKDVPSRVVLQLRRKNGMWRWVEVSLGVIDYRGKPAILSSLTDVTERKRAQDKMQENVERTRAREEVTSALARAGGDLQAVINTLARVVAGVLGDMCVVSLLSTDEAWVEPVAWMHSNRERQDYLGETLRGTRIAVTGTYLERIVNDHEPLLIPHIDAKFYESSTLDRYRAYSERWGLASLTIAPIRHAGRVIGVLGVAREQTGNPYTTEDQSLLQEFADRAALAIANAQLIEQLQAELNARREAEAKYRALVEQIPAITYLASAEHLGETRYVSPQIELFGYSPQEWTEPPDFWKTRVHPDDLPVVLAAADAARLSGTPFHIEYRLLARDGRTHYIRDDARWVHDENNQRLFQQGIMLDLGTDGSAETVGRRRTETGDREQRAFDQELGTAAALFNRAADYEQVMDDILDSAARILPYDTATIFLKDVEVLRVMRARGFEKYGLAEWVCSMSFPMNAPELKGMVEGNAAVVVPETRGSADWIPVPQVEWIRSHISAPLRIGGEIVGMLSMDSATPEQYRAEDGARVLAFADLAAVALRNAQLLRETRRRAVEFEALYETTQDLGRQSELAGLLEMIVTRATALLDSSCGAVFLWDAAREELILETQRGDFMPDGLRLAPGEGLAGMVARTRQPTIIADYVHWERRVVQPGFPEVTSLMGAPISYTGELIGVLILGETDGARRYQDEELRLLALYAGQAAGVVHNARLLQETRQRAEQLSMLYDVGLTLNRVLDSRTQLEFLFKIARRALHTDRMAFFRYDPSTEMLYCEMSAGLPTTLDEKLRAFPVSLKQGDSVVGWVAEQRLPARVSDVEADPRWRNLEPGDHSVLAVPVEHEKDLRGVLIATSEKYDLFTAQDERMLILFGNQIAAAMELTNLFEQQQQRQREMEILREASLAFSAALERDVLIAAILEYALRLVRGDNATLYLFENHRVVFGGALWAEDRASPRVHHEPQPDGLTYRVMRSGERIVIADALTDPFYKARPWHGAIVGQPLRGGGQGLGVLSVVFAEPHKFDANELHALDLLADQAAVALANLFHLDAQQRRGAELETLREAGLEFTATLDRAQLITLIMQYALQLVAADDATFFMFDDKSGKLNFGGVLWAKPEAGKPEHWVPRENGFTYQVAQTGKKIVIDEVNHHPLFANWQWGGAIVGLPLRGEGRVRAVLNVAYEKPHRFAAEELRVLELLADQAAVAFENARHYDETRQQLREAELLHRAGEALNHVISFEDALSVLANFFMEALDIACCCISLIDEAHDEVRVMLDRAPRPETCVAPGTIFRLSDHQPMHAALRGKTSIQIRRDDPKLSDQVKAYLDTYEWQTVLTLPLSWGDRFMGIVELGDEQTARDFSPSAVRLVESLAHQASTVLQNVQLREDGARRAAELTLVKRLASGIGAARTLDELLDVIQREALALAAADSFYVAMYDAETEQVDFVRFLDNGKALQPFSWRLAPSLTRQVITTGGAVRFGDYHQEASPDNPVQFYGDGLTMRAWLGVPLRIDSRVVGVISLQALRAGAFGEREEGLLQLIADQVAGALERVQRQA